MFEVLDLAVAAEKLAANIALEFDLISLNEIHFAERNELVFLFFLKIARVTQILEIFAFVNLCFADNVGDVHVLAAVAVELANVFFGLDRLQHFFAHNEIVAVETLAIANSRGQKLVFVAAVNAFLANVVYFACAFFSAVETLKRQKRNCEKLHAYFASQVLVL
jgi:hypothetical protein